MLNKFTMSAVGAAILVTVASASMALLRDRGPTTNQMIGIEPVFGQIKQREVSHPKACARYCISIMILNRQLRCCRQSPIND